MNLPTHTPPSPKIMDRKQKAYPPAIMDVPNTNARQTALYANIEQRIGNEPKSPKEVILTQTHTWTACQPQREGKTEKAVVSRAGS